MTVGNPAYMQLSSVEKSYQIIISRIDGPKVSGHAYRNYQLELVDKGIGGFIIFGGHCDEIREFISEAQYRARIPLFISSDIERGVGQQIEDMTLFPSQMAMAAAINTVDRDDVSLLDESLKAIIREATNLGVNMAFTPVLDINTNPDNPIICTRAFSDDPETVSWFGIRYIRAFEEAGILSCGKHFPGHGGASADSHIELPVINKTQKELSALELVPFRKAVECGVSCIMIGHLGLPALDTKPASLSEFVIKKLLRGDLGFEGLVVTDALNMHALKEYGDAELASMKAGADILLHPEDASAAASSVTLAIEQGRLDPMTLDLAVNRIIAKKANLPAQVRTSGDIETNNLLSKRLSQNSMTLVKTSAGILPLTGSNTRLVMSGDNKHFGSCILHEIFQTADIEDEDMLKDAVLVIAVFTSVVAWHGSSGISVEERARVKKLIRMSRSSVVISFGSPYVLRHFSEAGILVAAYSPTTQAQQAALDCLTGKAPFRGTLPVCMPGV
jgi:beta-N-acetylhexosaminidase